MLARGLRHRPLPVFSHEVPVVKTHSLAPQADRPHLPRDWQAYDAYAGIPDLLCSVGICSLIEINSIITNALRCMQGE